MGFTSTVLAGAAVLSFPVAASAALFSDNFDTNTSANWTTNQTAGVNAAQFAYDYSAMGIPSANGVGGTTLGLRLRANMSGAVQAVAPGISVSPNGQSFTGDYDLTFKAWLNYNGPLDTGGSGSTQMMTAGVGTAGNTVQGHGGTHDSVWFGAVGEGGTTDDYRAYPKAAHLTGTNTAYAAGGTNRTASSNAHYSSFGGNTAPAGQLSTYPGQTGTSGVGTLGFEWHDVLVRKQGNTVSWFVDGVNFANIDTTTITFGGNNIFLGHSDINTGVSSDPNAPELIFTLIDNVSVDVVPEPSALSLVGLAGLAMLRRRRRA